MAENIYTDKSQREDALSGGWTELEQVGREVVDSPSLEMFKVRLGGAHGRGVGIR